MSQQQEDLQFDYNYGFSMPDKPVFKAEKGLNEKDGHDYKNWREVKPAKKQGQPLSDRI